MKDFIEKLKFKRKIYSEYFGYCVDDFKSFITASRKPMIPPKRKIFIGQGNFEAIGKRFLESLIKDANLRPDDKVLDVGSGQGRMALPLTEFLTPNGEYYGLEIVNKAVEWCNQEYSAHPNFHFIHANVFNKHYNKKGKVKANQYKFPFEDETFHVIFLTSVFTHMYPDDVANYLAEIARCLKPNGKCVITYFLMNDESRKSIAENTASLSFSYPINENCYTATEHDPEGAIAYDEEYILSKYNELGLKAIGNIHYGHWIPRDKSGEYQDTIIAEKKD